MNSIVGIGANVYDTLITLPRFPDEDTKLRAEAVKYSGGGPCATGLVAAARLGAECAYIGVLSSDAAGRFLIDDMKKYGMTDEFVDVLDGYSSFSSCIWLNRENASRTCVFDKGNLPPLTLSNSQRDAIANAEILMVDGNELSAAIEGAIVARKNGTKVLYDAGGLYDGVEKLLPYADILIPSEEFALGFTGKSSAGDAAKSLYGSFSPKVVAVTCGKRGGVMFDGKELWNYAAFPVDAVDTNGAGDVFHGAFAFSRVLGYNYKKCCVFSSAVSALKCTGVGARESVPDFESTVKFLKERGYDEFEKDMD